MPRSLGRTGHRYRQAVQRLRKPGATCVLCGREIDVTLRWPHRWSFTLEHIDGNKDNNQPSNQAPAHLHCNSSEGARKRNRSRPARRPPRPITTRQW